MSDDYFQVAELLAKQWTILQPRRSAGEPHGGGDVDIAVDGLDAMWPLRLSKPWKLLQIRHYEPLCIQWVLWNGGTGLVLDTIEDPSGVGRYALPTSTFFPRSDVVVPPGHRASYLFLKRLRKGFPSEEQWNFIRTLVHQDPRRFEDAVGRALGARSNLAMSMMEQTVPSRELWRKARRLQRMRRLLPVSEWCLMIVKGGRRLLNRVVHPNGALVLIVGPDGAGKSSLAAELERRLAPYFRGIHRYHWRPRCLPNLGALLARQASEDSSNPHGLGVRPPIVSGLSLLYYWVDYLMGRVQFRILRSRSRLILLERGWDDMIVDPTRYRMAPLPRLHRTLRSLVFKENLMLVLTADARTIGARKGELTEREIARQTEEWRSLAADKSRARLVDVSRPFDAVADDAVNHVVHVMEKRATSSIASGWASIRIRRSQVLWLPRGPRSASRRALSIYLPSAPRAKLAWHGLRLASNVGALRMLPRCAPPLDVRNRLAPFVPRGGNLAVRQQSDAHRFTALILDSQTTPVAFAKLSLDSEDGRLEEERAALDQVRSIGLPSCLVVPRVLISNHQLLLTEFLLSKNFLGHRPPHLDLRVAKALGEFFRSSDAGDRGPAHGDFAPWNLIELKDGWGVVDWENFMPAAPAYFDLIHFFVQCASLLGRPAIGELVQGLRERGPLGEVFTAYRRASHLSEPPYSFWAAYSKLVKTRDEKDPRLRRVRDRVTEALDL